MKKSEKALLISVLVIFLMACNCNLLNLFKEKTGLESNSSEEQGGSSISVPDQATGKPSTQSTKKPSGQVSSDSDASFLPVVPTEVIVPDGILKITKAFTAYDEEIVSCKSYILIENTSTDPLDAVKEFSYVMTWYDDQGQIVDQWDHTWGPNVFPQEANIFTAWVDKDKLEGHKIVKAVFEIKDITTVNTFYTEGSVREKVANTPIKHPFFPFTATDFKMENDFLFGKIASNTVTVQSSLANKVGVQIVAFYFNDQNQVIGVGINGEAEVDPGASVPIEVNSYFFTETPTKAEYTPILIGPSDLLEVVYPGLYN
jgi:hypothetical protein